MASLTNENILTLIYKTYMLNNYILIDTKSKTLCSIILKIIRYKSLYEAMGKSKITIFDETRSPKIALLEEYDRIVIHMDKSLAFST
jgi:hypothetical protein